MDRRSKKILAIVVVLCVVAGGAYVAIAATGPSETSTDARPGAERRPRPDQADGQSTQRSRG